MENRRIIVLFAAHGDSVEKNLMAQVNMEEFGHPYNDEYHVVYTRAYEMDEAISKSTEELANEMFSLCQVHEDVWWEQSILLTEYLEELQVNRSMMIGDCVAITMGKATSVYRCTRRGWECITEDITAPFPNQYWEEIHKIEEVTLTR